MIIKNVLRPAAVALLCGCAAASAMADENVKFDYTPQVHGVIRARWEGEMPFYGDFVQRFMVRNARFSMAGKVAPSIDYFLQIDACDKGKMKFLDAWGRWEFAPKFQIRAGQFRVPYGVDCFKSPINYYFSNRSFLGKVMLNMRAVGAQFSWAGTEQVPVTVEAGAFNSKSISDHDVWQNTNAMNYAAKATWRMAKAWTVTGGWNSILPHKTRINMADACINFTSGRWVAEAEYEYKHYEHNLYDAGHGWNVYGVYTLPLQGDRCTYFPFHTLSFQARFDGMTNHSSGVEDANGNLRTDDVARNRVTLGTTLGYIRKPVKAEIRFDYEKYFYERGAHPAQGYDDKICAEFIVRF